MAGVPCSESMRGPWGSAKLRVSAPAEAGTPAKLNASGPAAGPGYTNNRLAGRDDIALRMPAKFTPKITGSWSEERGDVGGIAGHVVLQHVRLGRVDLSVLHINRLIATKPYAKCCL